MTSSSPAGCAPKIPTSAITHAVNAAHPSPASMASASAVASALSVPSFLHGNVFAATFASGLVTSIAMYPVDVLRAIRMSQAGNANAGGIIDAVVSFKRAHGWGGFIRQGSAPEIARSTTMQTLKFFLFPVFHEAMFDTPEREGTALTRAAAGATCAIVEGLAIGPIETSKVGLQLDSTNRFGNRGSAVLNHCVAQRGIFGVYTGYLGVQWRQSSWTGAFFGSLRFFERRVDDALALVGVDRDRRAASPTLSTGHKVLSGFTAGAFASLFNCPADVVRTNVQREFLQKPPAAEPVPLGLSEFFRQEASAHWRIATDIFRSKGLTGLYTGFATKAGHLGGCGALMACLVPRFKLLLGCE
mmetsp:Transcript_27827/g.93039  ORF Transcript_27827/g.93039 Transcript_27827/m.93039 type:complete len:358 (+) Transcript_27827:140-1213(+)